MVDSLYIPLLPSTFKYTRRFWPLQLLLLKSRSPETYELSGRLCIVGLIVLKVIRLHI